MALLEVVGLQKQYGRRTVVDGVDINVDAGEIVGLLGPNGAGKTTSFRMIVGMIAPKAGLVMFAGRDVTHLPMYQRARLGLGYLAQDSSVFRKLTVEQNLYAILEMMTTRQGRPFHATRRQRRERVDQLLEQFSLTRLRRNNSATLSGGERRRLEIARCLVSEPMLIMLDEPFTGIDPKTVGDIQNIVRQLQNDGIGVLITDHHVAETLRITDRSYLIAAGKVLTHGSPLEIVNDPSAREHYLGEHFVTAGIGEQLAAPAPVQTQKSLRSVLETQELYDLIDELGGNNCVGAAGKIRARGTAATPYLLQAMERHDRVVRIRAHRLLCDIIGAEIPFDIDAPEIQRTRQIAAIRAKLVPRQAG